MRLLILALSLLLPVAAAAQTSSDPVSAGAAIARAECAECHIVIAQERDSMKPGPGGAAPPFAAVALNPELTAERLKVFLRLPHGLMNNVLLTRRDIENVVAYIASLGENDPRTKPRDSEVR
jgi:mono/diheme cytochrome c family protein